LKEIKFFDVSFRAKKRRNSAGFRLCGDATRRASLDLRA
jgi:hypothetical protein